MPTFLTEVVFDLTNDAKPFLIPKEEDPDDKEGLVKHADFVGSMQNTTAQISQLVTQNNAESTRLSKNITDANLTLIDPTTGTLADAINQLNSTISLWQTNVLNGKQ